jgi:hypothetical protein
MNEQEQKTSLDLPTGQSNPTQGTGVSEMDTVQRLRTRVSERARRFLLAQLAHTAITLAVLGILLVGAARAGALDRLVAPAAQTDYSTEGFTINYQGRLADIKGKPVDNTSPGIDMTFALYITDTAGTPLWSETHFNVPVSQGLFSVRLGSINPLTLDLPAGDLWLGVQVGDDPEMTPRQSLDDSLRAMEAATARRLDATADAELNGHKLLDVGHIVFEDSRIPPKWGPSFGHITYPKVTLGQEANVSAVSAGIDITSSQQIYSYNGVMGASFPTHDRFELQLMVEANQEGYYVPVQRSSPEGSLTGREASVYIGGHENWRWQSPWPYQPGGLTVYANGDAQLDGSLDVVGALSHGALIENNLQSATERAAERIDRFSQGDVLCWNDGRLELCAQVGNPLVQAVADKNGKPIVLGAEPIKVLGPVRVGDLLVASDVPGYATVDDDPRPGTIIAQALEDFEEEQGLVKAMIRKF